MRAAAVCNSQRNFVMFGRVDGETVEVLHVQASSRNNVMNTIVGLRFISSILQ